MTRFLLVRYDSGFASRRGLFSSLLPEDRSGKAASQSDDHEFQTSIAVAMARLAGKLIGGQEPSARPFADILGALAGIRLRHREHHKILWCLTQKRPRYQEKTVGKNPGQR